jgi:hypothetical protein
MILNYGSVKICVITPQKCGITTVLGMLAFPMLNHFATKGNTRKQLSKDQLLFIGDVDEYKLLKNYQPDYVFGVVRDPQERFISAYKDRVLKKNKDNFSDRTLDALMPKLKELMQEKTDFGLHIRPQTDWLGYDPKLFTGVCYTSEINSVLKPKIENILATKIPDNHRNQSLDLSLELSTDHVDQLKKLYKNDYKLINELF